MGRRHDESDERKRAARTNDDAVEEDKPDDNVIGNPEPPTSKEYIDLEIARIQPPA